MPANFGPLLCFGLFLFLVRKILKLPFSFDDHNTNDSLRLLCLLVPLLPNFVVELLLELTYFNELRFAQAKDNLLLLHHLFINYRKPPRRSQNDLFHSHPTLALC
jgi:hypothetical protein